MTIITSYGTQLRSCIIIMQCVNNQRDHFKFRLKGPDFWTFHFTIDLIWRK